MKKTKLIIIFILSVFLMIGCTKQAEDTSGATSSIIFSDALGREVTITNPEKVGVASGSIAKIWNLAGGSLAAATHDAFEDKSIDFPQEIIDMGNLKEPSLETILSADLDLVFLIPGIKNHVQIADTLEKAGVQCVFVEIESFEDYLNILNTFTDITGRKDLYKENGLDIQDSITQTIESKKLTNSPKVLLLRTSESKVTVRDSNTMAGAMLKDLGCVNIADKEQSLLTDLSIEEIVSQQPDYIFVICMGDFEDGEKQLKHIINSNPVWGTLKAVKDDRMFYLDKELFHLKPNIRWGESYEVLAEYLSNEK
ncbi:ABC transporter substrate-binding protein [Anaerotignum sp. MB30-C6]|uniref:ABC transporter substrate-binding protein n=1 Tax=Anaerotignum sp. MB30-C6 TaxID=3070814 RepID=UPI0027DE89B3|nr:ABC transporter substrate-binding protein [Anaerotignum sp. MB30-C6]WMI80561.1 ABC transporter substrate-binding protein [Anaerotignum sp. MB30-C6]